MAKSWIRWINRIAVGIVVIVALALPVTLPEVTTAVVMKIAQVIPPLSVYLVIAIAVEVTLVLLAAIWWLWWRLPRRQVSRLSIQIPDPKARADAEDNFRKTVGQSIGGAAVLIGVAVAYLQFTQQQQVSREQLQAARELFVTNQVAKGFEQLGSDKLMVRIGGIYALAGVVNTAPQYYVPVLQAICAFVREAANRSDDSTSPASDVQTALTAIANRNRALAVHEVVGTVDLSRAKLSHADLSGANLKNVNLGRTDLRAASLLGADLSGAVLISTNLSNAVLVEVNLSGALLFDSDLSGAVLFGANLDSADLDGADLRGANVSQGQLDRACGVNAQLPPGLTLKKACPITLSTRRR